MQNSVVMFTFSDFDRQYHLWVNLVQKFKFVWSEKNLVPRLIWICRTQWPCFLHLKHAFWASLVQKMKIIIFSWNLIYSLTQIRRTQWWCSVFFLTILLFMTICFKKIKIVSSFWNLVPGLTLICRIQWRCSIFLFFIGITIFGQIWS